MRNRFIITFIISVFSLVFAAGIFVNAASQASVIQAYAWEQYIDIFTENNLGSIGGISVKASNRVIEPVDCGFLDEKAVLRRTTVLLDISASVPSTARETVKEFIETLVEHVGQNEELKFVTFGEQLRVLHDFTSDRYTLSEAIKNIEYKDQRSKIYDAVSNTIPELEPVGTNPCYYRTIVVTDGIDDTESGVTKEELYLKLRSSTYPVDVIAVSKVRQEDEDKNLSALTRISGGRYANIFPKTDVGTIIAYLSNSDTFWLRVSLPGELLDGSTRQIDITDGTTVIQFDLKIPSYTIPETATPGSGAKAGIPAKTAATPAVTANKAIDPATPPHTNGANYTPVFLIGGLIIVIIAACVTVAVVSIRRSRKSKIVGQGNNQAPPDSGLESYQSTQWLNQAMFNETGIIDSGETEILNPGKSGYVLTIHEAGGGKKRWTLPVREELVIGRGEYAGLRIDDKSVSRQQCKIVAKEGGLLLANLSKTNKTMFNGRELVNVVQVKPGDAIDLGRVRLIIVSVEQGERGKQTGDETQMAF